MPTPPTRRTKSKKRTPPATTEPSLCQHEDSKSPNGYKLAWDKRKPGRQIFQVGFRQNLGFSLCPCDFWGCISILDPLSNLAHLLFVFLFSIFFFFWKRNSGFSFRKEGARGLQALLGGLRAKLHQHLYRPSTPLRTGSWPHSQTTKGQRGESRCGPWAPGAHTSFQDLSQRVAFSETDFWGYCFYKHPTHSLSKLREIEKDREAWRVAVHGVTKSGTRLSDRQTLISLAGERGFVWEHWPSDRVWLNVPFVVGTILHADVKHGP